MACVSAAASRASSRSTFASSHSKNAASPMKPYLMTSARPARISRGGSVCSVLGVHEHGSAAGGTRRSGSCRAGD